MARLRGEPVYRSRVENFGSNKFFFNALILIRFFRERKGGFCTQEGLPRRSSPNGKILAAPLINQTWLTMSNVCKKQSKINIKGGDN